MKIPIGDHCLHLHNGGQLYICDNQADDGDVRISVVVDGCSLNFDLSILELRRVRELIMDAINDAFKVAPDIRCEGCGYTKEQALVSGDHRNCRNYPFFPGETGKTYAIG